MRKVLSIACAFVLVSTQAQNYFVSTVGGNGTQGLIDGQATATAELYWPYGLAYDGDSVIYFTDAGNQAIRKLSSNTHLITTIAGGNGVGLVDGPGASAKFNWPDGIFYKNGFLYIGDNLNNVIRKIDLSNNSVTTVAGTGTAGYVNGPAASAQFRGGNGIDVAVDNNGDIYVADGSNAVIRKISNGQVSLYAGTPGTYGYVDGPATSSQFHRPRYLALDTATGDLYITDINNNVIRKVSGGVVSTFSGTGVAGAQDGLANQATFSAPVGIARTFGGYFYVVDGGGNKLRKLDPSGNVTTIAGNGTFGFQDGAAANAEFYYPQGVCYDKHCYIYMADRDNNRIRSVRVPEGPAGCNFNSMAEMEFFQCNLYPNPSTGIIGLEKSSMEPVSYVVTDFLGKPVKQGNAENDKINLSELENGAYLITFHQNGQSSNRKLVLHK